MAFSALYSRCREEMLVTSDLALRTMLTEFIDHQMVKWRQNGENLYIPTDIGILRQFKQLILESWLRISLSVKFTLHICFWINLHLTFILVAKITSFNIHFSSKNYHKFYCIDEVYFSS